MSHELRTPLNSILILGQQLSDNPERQPDRQAGRVRPDDPRRRHRPAQPDHRHSRPLEDRVGNGHGRRRRGICSRSLLDMVEPHLQARGRERKGLSFDVQVDPRLGRSILTDSKRLQQVLKNLLSNAFKFTSQGGVRFNVSAAAGGWTPDHPVLSQAGDGRRRSRSRIPASAFRRRSSASSSRRSSRPTPARAASTAAPAWASRSAASWPICSAARFSSAARQASGSTFTLYLPLRYVGPGDRSAAPTSRVRRESPDPSPCHGFPRCACPSGPPKSVADDRDDVQPDDSTLLIVEDDPHYARILVDLARDKGLKVLVAMRGRRGARAGQAVPARPPCRSMSSCRTCSDGRSSAS